MGKRSLLILLLVLGLCFPVYIFAETIVLKSGKTVEGKILEKTDKYIKIDFYGVPLTYYFDDIKSIDGQSPILAAEETKAPSVAPDSSETKETSHEVAVSPKSNEEAKSIRKLPFSTAIITYKYKGNPIGKEMVYIDAVNNKIAQEIEIVGSLRGQSAIHREMNIYDGNIFYHINLEENEGTKEEWKGDAITSIFRENEHSDYYKGETSFSGKTCKVYKIPNGTLYFWNGIVLREEMTSSPFLEAFNYAKEAKEINYIREAVEIQLNVEIPADKFQVPSGVKLLTKEDIIKRLKDLSEEMKSGSRK